MVFIYIFFSGTASIHHQCCHHHLHYRKLSQLCLISFFTHEYFHVTFSPHLSVVIGWVDLLCRVLLSGSVYFAKKAELKNGLKQALTSHVHTLNVTLVSSGSHSVLLAHWAVVCVLLLFSVWGIWNNTTPVLYSDVTSMKLRWGHKSYWGRVWEEGRVEKAETYTLTLKYAT